MNHRGENLSWKVLGVILNEKVPVVTSLIAVMGLPSCGKTKVLESVLKQKIELKDGAELGIDYYLNRKRDEKCLSIYDLCALGSSQHNKYAWSFATNRHGAIYSILCKLIRLNLCVADIELEDTDQAPKSVMDRHVRWLMRKTKRLLENIKEEPGKLALIQDGVSLINVIDVGVNKALYEFLSIMLLSCHRHIRLAFFSLDRDAPNLQEMPDLPSDRYGERKDDVLVMKHRSRLAYLLHFATIGYTQQQWHGGEVQNATVMIATRAKTTGSTNDSSSDQAKDKIIQGAQSQGVDQFLENWLQVDVNASHSVAEFRKKVEGLVEHKYKQRMMWFPLKWIVLRSLVVSLDSKGVKVMILRRSFIIHKAKELKMAETEVDEFLKAFTDFGSILYTCLSTTVLKILSLSIFGSSLNT